MTFHKDFPSPAKRIKLLYSLHSEVDTTKCITYDNFSSYFYLKNHSKSEFSEEISYLQSHLSQSLYPNECFFGLKFNKLHHYFWKANNLEQDFILTQGNEVRISFLTFLYRHWRSQYHLLPEESIQLNASSDLIIQNTNSFLTKFQKYILREQVQSLKQLSQKSAISLLSHYFQFITDSSIKLYNNEFVNLKLFIESIDKEQTLSPQEKEELLFLTKITSKNAPVAPREPIIIEKNTNNSIQIIGYPFSPSGLGEDTRTTLDSTKKAFKVELLNLGEPNQLEEYKPYEQFISDDLSQSPKIRIFNSPPNIGAIVYEKFGKSFFKDSYNIGYCPWELNTWKESLKDCFNFFDEIWAPSKFLYDCYSKLNLNIPIKHIPLSVEIPRFKSYDRNHFNLPEDSFLFYFSFDFNSSFYRKNPNAVMEAFLLAFEENNPQVGLVLKCLNPQVKNTQFQNFIRKAKQYKNIKLIMKKLSADEVFSLYKCTNTFVSLHRSEGFGRCIAEAICIGHKPIVTEYSGNLDFCNSGNCLFVDAKMTNKYIDTYPYTSSEMMWADPNIKQAAQLMRSALEATKRESKDKSTKKLNSSKELIKERIYQMQSKLSL